MGYSETEKAVLKKLYVDGFVGARHTSVDNVPKGFPKHLRGDVKKAVKKLNKKGFFIVKPTSYGLEISLNPRKMKEIKRIIQET